MKAPWEQEWKVPAGNGWIVRDEAGVNRLHVYNDEMTKEESDAVVKFAAAAPDMARELVSALRSKSDLIQTQEGRRMRLWLTVEQVQAMAAAVKKAGVPL